MFFWVHVVSQKNNFNPTAQTAVNTFANAKELHSASISISIYDLETNKVIAEFDKDKILIPASVMKILSTGLLLDLKGEDFQFETPFFLQGSMDKEGVFNGNVKIIGSGDPSFCSDQIKGTLSIDQIADTLSRLFLNQGIQKFKGSIRVDESFIEDIPENPEWLWYDLGNYYGAGCHSLNIFENVACVSLARSFKTGRTCEICDVFPEELEELFCSNVISTQVKPKEDIFVLGTSQNKTYTLHGGLACCGLDTVSVKASIPNPAILFVEILGKKLAERGILFLNEENISSEENTWVYTVRSPSLKIMAERAIKKSVNLYCESFLHWIGFIFFQHTNRKNALDGMKAYYEAAGLESQGYYVVDGSGLSPKNAISAQQLVQILAYLQGESKVNNFHLMLNDLVVEGSLSGILSENKINKEKLYFKSGSMERVRSYAGYILKDGKPKYSVGIIVNNFTCSGFYLKKKFSELFADLSNL